MKFLQGLTVCVNYADLLKCILPNRRHFDHWLVVTHQRDKETIAFCKRENIDYICSKLLYQGGATFNKAKALNEGIDALKQREWVAVIDSDIYLPDDFRERLNAQQLNWRCLYGLEGRRVCLDYAEFEILRHNQPWNALWYSTAILGYFHLFHLSQTRSRYPEGTSSDASTYDMVYSESFPESLRNKIPIPCLHLGPVKENWQGRKSRKFVAKGKRRSAQSVGVDTLLQDLDATGNCRGTVLQLGFQDPKITWSLAEQFEKVLLIDAWGVDGSHWSALVERDRELLSEKFRRQTAGLTNIEILGPNTTEVIDSIEDGSLQGIFLDGEPDAEIYSQLHPLLKGKIETDGFVAGQYYSIEHFGDSTETISVCIGAPERVFSNGSWWLPSDQWRGTEARFQAVLERPADDSDSGNGVLYFVNANSDLDALFASLHSLRQWWEGGVAIIDCDGYSIGLDLACRKFGTELIQGSASSGSSSAAHEKLLAFLSTPFERTLYLEPETIVTGPLDGFFSHLETAEVGVICLAGEDAQRRQTLATLELAAAGIRALDILTDVILEIPPTSFQAFGFANAPATLLDRSFPERMVAFSEKLNGKDLSPEESTIVESCMPTADWVEFPGSWISWNDSATTPNDAKLLLDGSHSGGIEHDPSGQQNQFSHWAEVIKSSAVPVRSRQGHSVVTVVLPENFHHFLKNSLTWKFQHQPEISVICVDLSDEMLGSLTANSAISVHRFNGSGYEDPEMRASEALLALAAEVCNEDRMIYVNAGCFPNPGAELFADPDWDRFGAVGCGWWQTRAGKPSGDLHGVLRNPMLHFRHLSILGGIGMLKRSVAEEASARWKTQQYMPIFDRTISAIAYDQGERIESVKAERWGWQGC